MNINIKTCQENSGKPKHHSFIVLALALVGVIGSLGLATSVHADTLYRTSFEQPTFTAGVPLVGQDTWAGAPPLSPNAALISTNRPRQGRQSVLVQGKDLVSQPIDINIVTGGYYDAIGSYRKTVNHDTGGTEAVRVSSHVRVDGRRTARGNNFFSASIAVRGTDDDQGNGNTGIGELAISSDGRVYGYSGNDFVPGCEVVPCVPAATFLTSVRASLGEWHNLAIEANFATRTYTFFVDDECLGSFPFVASFTGNFLRRGSLIAYAAPDTATLHKDAYKSKYDQFSIKVVEPEECSQ
jgi:hypothetical protein